MDPHIYHDIYAVPRHHVTPTNQTLSDKNYLERLIYLLASPLRLTDLSSHLRYAGPHQNDLARVQHHIGVDLKEGV